MTRVQSPRGRSLYLSMNGSMAWTDGLPHPPPLNGLAGCSQHWYVDAVDNYYYYDATTHDTGFRLQWMQPQVRFEDIVCGLDRAQSSSASIEMCYWVICIICSSGWSWCQWRSLNTCNVPLFLNPVGLGRQMQGPRSRREILQYVYTSK